MLERARNPSGVKALAACSGMAQTHCVLVLGLAGKESGAKAKDGNVLLGQCAGSAWRCRNVDASTTRGVLQIYPMKRQLATASAIFPGYVYTTPYAVLTPRNAPLFQELLQE